ncbi:hypothetical protein HK102_003467 [Quaeritorhiza haematococci]|nr:hypothetical protein HK102_003467 [Quaeritorhiza haematococci]
MPPSTPNIIMAPATVIGAANPIMPSISSSDSRSQQQQQQQQQAPTPSSPPAPSKPRSSLLRFRLAPRKSKKTTKHPTNKDDAKTYAKMPDEELDMEVATLASSFHTARGLGLDETEIRQLLKTQGLAVTIDFLHDMREAAEGILLAPLPPFRKVVDRRGVEKEKSVMHFLGAENAGNTCYIDSLLFAMFIRESVFDGILTRSIPVPPTNLMHSKLARLQTSLRLVVNQMRSGKLVTKYVMSKLRNDMIACGWSGMGAMSKGNTCSQEDVSELYLFLTSVFGAPFLPMEKELFHGGRTEVDDSKLATERIIQLSIPPAETTPASSSFSEDGATAAANLPVQLEDLLVEYFFNNRVNVTRMMEHKPADPRSTRELSISGATESSSPISLSPTSPAPGTSMFNRRQKRGSVSSTTTLSITKKDGSLRVSVDAWQVNRLLPFFTPQNEAGEHVDTDLAPASEFSGKNVILPLLLKRYEYENGKLKRLSRKVMIPHEIPFNLFVMHGSEDERTYRKRRRRKTRTPLNQNPAQVDANAQPNADVDINSPKKGKERTSDPADGHTQPHQPHQGPRVQSQRRRNRKDPFSDIRKTFATEYTLRLKAVVAHVGNTPQMGHYIAFANAGGIPDLVEEESEDEEHGGVGKANSGGQGGDIYDAQLAQHATTLPIQLPPDIIRSASDPGVWVQNTIPMADGQPVVGEIIVDAEVASVMEPTVEEMAEERGRSTETTPIYAAPVRALSPARPSNSSRDAISPKQAPRHVSSLPSLTSGLPPRPPYAPAARIPPMTVASKSPTVTSATNSGSTNIDHTSKPTTYADETTTKSKRGANATSPAAPSTVPMPMPSTPPKKSTSRSRSRSPSIPFRWPLPTFSTSPSTSSASLSFTPSSPGHKKSKSTTPPTSPQRSSMPPREYRTLASSLSTSTLANPSNASTTAESAVLPEQHSVPGGSGTVKSNNMTGVDGTPEPAASGGMWYRFDDLAVPSSSSSSTAPSSDNNGGGRVKLLTDIREVTAAFDYISSNAYMLFYELCKDEVPSKGGRDGDLGIPGGRNDLAMTDEELEAMLRRVQKRRKERRSVETDGYQGKGKEREGSNQQDTEFEDADFDEDEWDYEGDDIDDFDDFDDASEGETDDEENGEGFESDTGATVGEDVPNSTKDDGRTAVRLQALEFAYSGEDAEGGEKNGKRNSSNNCIIL